MLGSIIRSMFCPQCKVEYRAGFTRCTDCHVDLVQQLPECRDASQESNAAESAMKRPEARVIAVLIVVSLAVWGVWAHRWRAQVAQREEMRALYAFASGGDLDKVKRLSEYPSPEAIQWLEKLAQDWNATSDSRTAAIAALASKPSLNRAALSTLLYIDQPFVVRHAAAEVLGQRGCDDQCISTTLRGLRAIWQGQPAFEVGLSTVEHAYGVRGDPELDAKIDAELKANTEQDYWRLLENNPCAARNALKTDTSAEPAFVENVQSKLKPCP